MGARVAVALGLLVPAVAPGFLIPAITLGVLIPAVALAQGQPAARQWTTPSGARVQFVESRAVPMVDIAVDFAAGSAYDPPAKPGTAALTHALLNAGTADLSEDELAAAYADVGAIPGGTIDRDRATLQLRTLSSGAELRRAVAGFAAMVQRPAFPPAAFERERARLAARLREEEVQPGPLADRRFYAGLYGRHPYGRMATAETVSAVEREDVLRFHRGHYSADRVVVTILGDLSAEAAREIAAQVTAALPARGDGAAVPPVAPPPRAERIVVPHSAQQAHVRVGLPALARTDPDYFPLLVGNYVLGGGGFVSRLTRDIRDERGYAYSVYSYFLPLERPGTVPGRPADAPRPGRGRARARARGRGRVRGKWSYRAGARRREGEPRRRVPAADRLEPEAPQRVGDHRVLRLPETWLADFPREIERVTAADVRAAFARHVRPERFVTVVVGADEGK